MTRLGVFVGEDKWLFFKEIYRDLKGRYQTEVYRPKRYRLPVLGDEVNRWASRRRLKNMLRRNDICFFEWASDLLVEASHAPKSCVVVTRLHSFELYAWAPKVNWDNVDRVILVSRAMERRLTGLYPRLAGRTVVVPNGVSLDKFSPRGHARARLNMGTVCRITPIKRVYELVLTCYALHERGHDVHLHVAGDHDDDGRYAVAIERLIDRLDLRAFVHLHGPVADVPAWLEQVDVFVSNSYWEGHQVALVEAMATGCYCLAHFWDGAEEILPPENLYVTDVELQDKLLQYWAQPETEQQAAQREMRRRVEERCDVDQQLPRIRQTIETALQGKAKIAG